MENNLIKIVTILNNGLNSLSRKFDNLALELRRKPPAPSIKVDIGDNVAKGVSDALKEGLAGLEMPKFEGFPPFPEYPAFPEIPPPQVNITVPEIKLPKIVIPETIVNVPPANITVEPTPVTFPDELKVKGMKELIEGVNRETEEVNIFKDVTSKNPLAVQMVDDKGKPFTANDFGGGLSGPSTVQLKANGDTVSTANPLPVDATFSGTIAVALDKANDSVAVWSNTAKDGSGTAYQPIVDSDGHFQIDVLSLPTVTVQATDLDIRNLSSSYDSVASVQFGVWNIQNITGTISLPTGASTATNQTTIIGHLDGVEGLLTTIDTDTGDIAVDVNTIAGAVSGTEMQVDVVTLPGIVGTIADDSTTPGNPVMVGGFAISPDGTDPGSVAEADVARFRTDLNRRLLVNTHHPRTLHKHLNGSSAYTDESIVADPGDGFQIVITSIIASTGAATALNFFLEESTTTIFGPIYLEAVAGRGFASGPIYLPVTASTAVTLTSSAAIAQSFDIDYYIQAV